MKSLGGGNKAIDTIKSPHKRETFYEIRNIAHKKENKENIKERLFSQPQPFCEIIKLVGSILQQKNNFFIEKRRKMSDRCHAGHFSY